MNNNYYTKMMRVGQSGTVSNLHGLFFNITQKTKTQL